ncbi:MAG: phage protein GemA/Gp16 family protein [Desulfurivibrionaceae bacterium]
MLDRAKLAVIHITVKELGLSDWEYRDTLEKVTGVRSSRDLDAAAFRKLMRYFARSKDYRSVPTG